MSCLRMVLAFSIFKSSAMVRRSVDALLFIYCKLMADLPSKKSGTGGGGEVRIGISGRIRNARYCCPNGDALPRGTRNLNF